MVISFFVCWAPYHAQRLLYTLHMQHQVKFIPDELYYELNEKLSYTAGVFLYMSSTINPIIYNIMSAKYRKAFSDTFFRPFQNIK